MKTLIVILLIATACSSENISPCAKLRAEAIEARQNMEAATDQVQRETYKQQYLSLTFQANECYQ